jgi:hypothetical protein
MGRTDLPYAVSFEASDSGVACVHRDSRHVRRVLASCVRQQDLVTLTCTSARTSHQAEARVHLYLDRKLRRAHHRGDRSTSGPSGIGRSTCSRSARGFCEAYGCHRRTGTTAPQLRAAGNGSCSLSGGTSLGKSKAPSLYAMLSWATLAARRCASSGASNAGSS